MQKLEIYVFLCKNSSRLFNRKGGILNIKNHEIFKKIKYDFISANDLYDFLHDKKQSCRLNSCNKKKRFRSFTTGYYDFCSLPCTNKWLSESRIGKNNPIHNISDNNRKKWKAKLSKQVKERIAAGKWTPNVTNSWCHSRYKIQFKRNNKIIKQKVRSSWEAFFQLMNTNYLYEKLRIPYLYNNEWHNYIVDFIDNDKKEVVEIKPKSEELKQKNINKQAALITWCECNNFKLISINEDYFKSITWDDTLLVDQPDKERLDKFRKYFK